MIHIKRLGLLAIAVTALTAFAGTASASTVTSPTGTAYTSTFEATAGPTNFTGSYVKMECGESTMKGKIESHGASITAGGKLEALYFGRCNYEVTVNKPGMLEIHGLSGTENGTVTWTGAEFTMHTSVGQCIFTTNGTHLGTLTAGVNARIDIASAKIPRTGGNFLCGSSSTWNAPEGYVFSTPSSLYVD